MKQGPGDCGGVTVGTAGLLGHCRDYGGYVSIKKEPLLVLPRLVITVMVMG